MVIRAGDTVEGINREQRHMEVLQVLNDQTVICQWYDEQGKQTFCLPVKELRFIADVPTQQLLKARRTWVLAKLEFIRSQNELENFHLKGKTT